MKATLVGSRPAGLTPPLVRQIAMAGFSIASRGFAGRSGYAEGSDSHFDRGYKMYESAAGKKVEFTHWIPWRGFGGDKGEGVIFGDLDEAVQKVAKDTARDLLGSSHWGNLSPTAKILHSRNVLQVLGEDFESPSEILVCCAEPCSNGVKGGTNTAFRLAKEAYIPCYNLYADNQRHELYEFLESL